MSLIVKEKDIVVPGEVLAEGMDFIPGYNTYRKENNIISEVLGLVALEGRAIKLMPLSGRYDPRRGDTIVGRVIDVMMSGWRIEFGSAYSAMLSLKEASSSFIRKGENLREINDIGDYVSCKIYNVTSQKLIDISMREPGLRKLSSGNIIMINSKKIPRVIGAKGSMIQLIKDNTGCRIVAGQNGWIWIEGSPEGEILAKLAIDKISEEAHTSGLTDRMIEFFKQNPVKDKMYVVNRTAQPQSGSTSTSFEQHRQEQQHRTNNNQDNDEQGEQ